MITYTAGTFTHNVTNSTFTYFGTAYRTVPHDATEPLTAQYSIGGGRWNAPQTNLILYTFTNVSTAQMFLTHQAHVWGFDWTSVNPEKQQDLLIMQLNVDNLADLATNAGLQFYDLPIQYPTGLQNDTAWPITQPIGQRVFASGLSGLVTRSASSPGWSGAMTEWGEVAVFPDRVSSVVLLERVRFSDWYGR